MLPVGFLRVTVAHIVSKNIQSVFLYFLDLFREQPNSCFFFFLNLSVFVTILLISKIPISSLKGAHFVNSFNFISTINCP